MPLRPALSCQRIPNSCAPGDRKCLYLFVRSCGPLVNEVIVNDLTMCLPCAVWAAQISMQKRLVKQARASEPLSTHLFVSGLQVNKRSRRRLLFRSSQLATLNWRESLEKGVRTASECGSGERPAREESVRCSSVLAKCDLAATFVWSVGLRKLPVIHRSGHSVRWLSVLGHAIWFCVVRGKRESVMRRSLSQGCLAIE